MKLRGEEILADSVADLVRLRSALGEAPFLTVDGSSLTFGEADERSDAFARGLSAIGLRKGDVLATYMYNSVEHACLWFACAKLGVVWAPLNVSLVGEDLDYCLRDTEAAAIVLDGELAHKYADVRSTLGEILECGEYVLGEASYSWLKPLDSLELSETSEGKGAQAAIDPREPAAIIYTGGSTGMPKGVVVPQLYFIANAVKYGDVACPEPGDVHFSSGHMFHASGQMLGLIGPMYSGISTNLTHWFSVSRYWEQLAQAGATIVDPVGPMLTALVRQPASKADRDNQVRVGVGIGTGQVRPEIRSEFEERFEIPLLEVYAQTESGIMTCSQTMATRKAGSSGRPQDGGWAEYRIVDEYDREVPLGEEGQILLRPLEPYCFMLEYHNKPELTVEAWRNLWFHTGDLGRMDEEGYLYFTGRLAHWIRRRGENISAFEVERVISSHPNVADCAVVGVPADLGEEDVKVYIEADAELGPVEPRQIIDYASQNLSYFKVPRYVEYTDALPRSITKNEIERHILRERGIGDAWDSEANTAE